MDLLTLLESLEITIIRILFYQKETCWLYGVFLSSFYRLGTDPLRGKDNLSKVTQKFCDRTGFRTLVS